MKKKNKTLRSSKRKTLKIDKNYIYSKLSKSKLNFGENLLTKNDESKAITFISENGFRKVHSWKELNKNVSKITNGDFVVFHRVAISENHLGKGYAKKMMTSIESYALNKNIYSIKADTNHDNEPMKRIFETLGYQFCGRVYFRGSPRNAFEKVLK